MIDQQAVFDSMVKKHAKNPQQAEKIIGHKLYATASARLAGSC